MFSNQYNVGRYIHEVSAWEHDDPEQAPLYQQVPAVTPDAESAAAIDLTGIYRMTETQVMEALRLEEAA